MIKFLQTEHYSFNETISSQVVSTFYSNIQPPNEVVPLFSFHIRLHQPLPLLLQNSQPQLYCSHVMERLKIFSMFTSRNVNHSSNDLLPSSNNPSRQNLINNDHSNSTNDKGDASRNPVFNFLQRFKSGGMFLLVSLLLFVHVYNNLVYGVLF